MEAKIPIPVKGQPLMASWAAAVSHGVNAIGAMVPSGGLAREGVTGMGFAALPANLRERRGSAKKIPGRFEITLTADEMPEGSEPEDQTYTATFANPYYDIGGKTYEMSGGESGEVSLEEIKDGSIIYIKISAEGSGMGAELGTSLSLTELQSLQENSMGYYTVPLYKIQGGSVVCDFRTGPITGMGET